MNRRRFLLSSLASSAVYAGYGHLPAGLAEPAHQVEAGSLPEAVAGMEPLPEALQQKLAHDVLRPQFHLLPRHNWMNDPCAPRFHRGQYHMFFQYNPNAAVWGDMHWNHATSPDMIHWKHQPVAIAPGPGDFDAYGIFTGSVLPGMDVASILYTGVSRSEPQLATIRGDVIREVQCLATSTDPELRTWKKLDKPVISSPPAGLHITGFRDPCPWKDGDTWYLGIGSGFNRVGGAILLYSSKDGMNWTYLHPLAQGKWNGGTQTDPVDTGEMWECPDFFPLGDKHVLLYSTERKVYWNVGVFDKKELRFHAETTGLLDQGAYYAMKSMPDEQGRRILWGWVTEKRSPEACIEAGWAGCMALPRVLTINAENQLCMEVPAEFASLRRNVQSMDGHVAGKENPWLAKATIRNRSAQVLYTFKAGDLACALELHAEGVAAPLLTLSYNGHSAQPRLTVGDKTLKLSPDDEGLSTIQLWMDGSVVELFADKREVLTARIYELTEGEIHLAWVGGTGPLRSISVSEVSPISPDRLTT
jgi:beta-fructofuranosidase